MSKIGITYKATVFIIHMDCQAQEMNNNEIIDDGGSGLHSFINTVYS